MAGEISRIDGRITAMPRFSPEQRRQLAEAIARSMVQMARADIAKAVAEMRRGS